MRQKRVDLQLPRPHPGQQQIINESARFNALACGRRFGKTQLGLDRIVRPALDGKKVAWFAAAYKAGSEVWRMLQDVLAPVIVERSQQEHRLDLMGGGSLDLWSLDGGADAARGRKYACVVLDECSLVHDLERAWEESIRPMLADLRGDAYFLFTPRGINHFTHTLFQRGQDPYQTEWRSWQMHTSANPLIDPAEIQSMKAGMSELAYRQEICGEFVQWEGQVFRNLDRAILPEPVPPHLKRWAMPHYFDKDVRGFVIGVDWAGSTRGGDFTVFCVVGFDGVVYEVDRFRGLEYGLQRERLKSLMARYRPVKVLGESNSIGGPVQEQLRRDGAAITGFVTQNQTKARIVEGLALAFEREEIKIPNDAVLIGELQSFEGTTLPATGLTRYAAAGNGHDDTVIALCLAWEARRTMRGYYPSAIELQEQMEAQRAIAGYLC